MPDFSHTSLCFVYTYVVYFTFSTRNRQSIRKKSSEFQEYEELSTHLPSTKYRKSKIIVFVNLGEAGVFLMSFRKLIILHILLKKLSGRKWAKKVVQFWIWFWSCSCPLYALAEVCQVCQNWSMVEEKQTDFWTESCDKITICESTSWL